MAGFSDEPLDELLLLPPLLPPLELLDLLDPQAARANASAHTTPASASLFKCNVIMPPLCMSFGRYLPAFGLSASWSPSPTRLKASTVNSNATPGNSMYHQTVWKLLVASEII